MKNEICKREKCTGCSACAEICPKGCIAMLPDGEGFLRPFVEKGVCVDCGLCQKICPINNPVLDDEKEPAAFAVRHRDERIRKISSSGGAFSALALQFLSQGGAVIGAGFDEAHMVIHKVCTNESDLDDLRRSKYVQSDIHGTYRNAKNLLEKGKMVLFCGTPCQVGGIKAYLGIEYPNLYTVDFICHGVPSPTAWKKYLEFREKEAGTIAKDISFRSKIMGWKKYSLEIYFQDDKKYSGIVGEDFYLRSFVMDMDLRPSCYQCQFKQLHRQADVTMADFWGIDRMDTAWNNDTGVSLVMIHSEKGRQLMNATEVDLEVQSVTLIDALASNPSMTHSVLKPALREQFMKDMHKLSFDKLHERYCGSGVTAKIRRKVAKCLNRLKYNEK